MKHQDETWDYYDGFVWKCSVCGRPRHEDPSVDNSIRQTDCNLQIKINKTHKWIKLTDRKFDKKWSCYQCKVCGATSYGWKYAEYSCDESIIRDIIE